MRSKGFFYNMTGFVFEYFCDSQRILATFAKFCLNSPFATWAYRLHIIQCAHAQAPLHLPHKFFDVKVFTKSFQLLLPNLAKALLVLAPDMLFSCGDWATLQAQKNAKGGGVCKVLCQKAFMGDGGELKHELDDVFGI